LDLVGSAHMNWLVWLGLAVVVAAIAAVTGVKPKGTRPVAHSRMMGMGRVALLVIVVIFAYLAYRARGG
jgi:ABC-type maltose transport system permease subunit